MIAAWIALSIAFAAGMLIIAVSLGIRQADRMNLAVWPSTPLTLLARRVVRLYVRSDELVQPTGVSTEASNRTAA